MAEDMRLTLRISKQLHDKAKQYKAKTKISVNSQVIVALTKYLKENMDADLYEYYEVEKNKKI